MAKRNTAGKSFSFKTKKIIRFCIIACISVCLPFSLPAQQPAYFTIGEDELKDDHIYTIHQGEDEIIYAGTNNGLFAYKHGAFEKIEGPTEQIGLDIFDLKRDNNGDLFCMNLDGQIFQLVNNKLVLFYQTPPEHINVFFKFYFNGDNDIIIASNSLIKISRATKRIKIYHLGLLEDIRFFKQISQNHFSFTSNGVSYELKNDHINKLLMFDSKKNKIYNDQLHPFISANPTHFISTPKDPVTNIPTITYIYNDSINTNGYKHDHERTHQFNDHEFFLIHRKKGVRVYQKENNAIIDKGLWFPGQFISKVFQTQDGKILLGTFGEGINIVPNRNIIKENIIPLHEKCNGLTNRNGILYFTTDAQSIYSFNDNFIKLEQHYKDNSPVEKIFHVEGFNHFKKDGLKHFIYNIMDKRDINNYSSLKDVWELPDKRILIAHSWGLSFYNENKINHSKWINSANKNFYNFTPLRGRTKSVCYAPASKTIYVSHKGELLAIDSIYDISGITYQNKNIACEDLFFKDETLYIATQKHGILILDNNRISKKYSTENGLGHHHVKKIKIVNNQLFISHINGFQIINLETDEIKTIGPAEGVSKGKISDFDTDGEQLWILRKNEILSLYVDQLQPYDSNIILHFDSLTVNDEKINIQKEHLFNYQQRKFNFHLDFRSAVLQNEVKISHQLEGEDDNWLTTKNYNISYKALSPGKYIFRAYAEYRNKKSNEFIYSFKIHHPIWQRWWFIILASLFIFASFYLFYKIRMKQLRQLNQAALEKEKAEKEMMESELKALRSQMNPHFIFNSLNSIQDLILREETDKSYDYIVLFADLVRSTLNHSNKKLIPIEKELEFLNVYLSLEKLRFKENFNYTIYSSDIEGIEIPSLVIQPFIENALLHGLLHKKGKKELNIHFEIIDHMLSCTVTDNGIGRERAMEIRKRQRGQHESFSMEAIKKRLAFLNSQHNVGAGYEFIDLMEEGQAVGTKVIVRLPYKNLF